MRELLSKTEADVRRKKIGIGVEKCNWIILLRVLWPLHRTMKSGVRFPMGVEGASSRKKGNGLDTVLVAG